MTTGDEIKPSEVEAKNETKDVKDVATTKAVEVPASRAPVSEAKIEEVLTKAAIRTQMWTKLERSELVLFPRPCTYRIPRFKGENEAVEKLAELDIFKNAKVVKVNLDKAHERVRLEIIQSGKELVAGTPGLREAVFLLMRPPMEPNKIANKMAASRLGINHLGTALDFSSQSKADLIVLGSVAVDKKGHRIGKGEGFSDLEYALLAKLGAISPNAKTVTIVHDAQIYDELPESIFKPHDVPVDVIVTPTQVIKIEKPLPRPTLTWNLLSNRRVNDIPIIKQLLDKEKSNGVKIELKEVDSEPETHRPILMRRRRFVRRRRQASAPEPRQQGRPSRRDTSAPPSNRNSRTFRRRPRRQTVNGASVEQPKVEGQQQKPMRRGPMRRISRPRYTVDFSIRVNGLTSSVRIRDLKAALIARGVRPNDISWRAAKGVALLHFAKKRQQEAPAPSVDSVMASLQGLSITPEEGPTMSLKIEAARPITARAAPQSAPVAAEITAV